MHLRKEYISYLSDLPINISFCSVKNYPIHWQDAIEIIYVLKGSINVTIDTDTMVLKENNIEIVNMDEAHRLYSNEDNRVLIFHIDPDFFEKYYNDMKNMFFYTNSEERNSQKGEAYEELRTFLAIILCETIQKKDDYDEYIEKSLIDLLYHLINNFNYLIYYQEELKDNEEQLERYHRISKYIYNNYNNNITLQDIADKEFLSTNYLSHEIKYATGYSFTDLINLTRVQESLKLLLDTDMTLSEISEEVGFSHTRYLNKHFKLNFKMTPLQFRKKNKVDEATYEREKQISYLPMEEALKDLSYYIEDYERYNFINRIQKININAAAEKGEFKKNFKEIINLGDAFDLLIEDNKDMLEELQYEVTFKYAQVERLFSVDMGIFPGNNFYNWSRVRTILEYLESISLIPLITVDNKSFKGEELSGLLNNFAEYFSDLETTSFTEYNFLLSKDLTLEEEELLRELLEEKYSLRVIKQEKIDSEGINYIYDTPYMLPYLIHSLGIKEERVSYLKPYDILDREVRITNEVFFGYPGLMNDKGIKKPSYYAYFLLNKLGDTLIDKGEGYIATKSDGEYQILIYSYNDSINELIPFDKYSKGRRTLEALEKNYSVNIMNLRKNTKLTLYQIDETIGSSYNYWLAMGRPKRLNKEEEEIMLKASFPRIDFQFSKKATVLNLRRSINSYGAILIILKEV